MESVRPFYSGWNRPKFIYRFALVPYEHIPRIFYSHVNLCRGITGILGWRRGPPSWPTAQPGPHCFCSLEDASAIPRASALLLQIGEPLEACQECSADLRLLPLFLRSASASSPPGEPSPWPTPNLRLHAIEGQRFCSKSCKKPSHGAYARPLDSPTHGSQNYDDEDDCTSIGWENNFGEDLRSCSGHGPNNDYVNRVLNNVWQLWSKKNVWQLDLPRYINWRVLAS